MKSYEETGTASGITGTQPQTRRWCLPPRHCQGVAGRGSVPEPEPHAGLRGSREGRAHALGSPTRHAPGRWAQPPAWEGAPRPTAGWRSPHTKPDPRAWEDGAITIRASRAKTGRNHTDFRSWQRKPGETGRHSLDDSLLQVGVWREVRG